MEQRVLTAGRLLDEAGNLREAGYATSLARVYDRRDIRARKSRIKEWDYFYIGGDQYGTALTVADNSYMTMVSFSLMDFTAGTAVTASDIRLLTRKRIALPSASFGGDIRYESDRAAFVLAEGTDSWTLRGRIKRFNKAGEDFACAYEIEKYEGDTMTIATPFRKRRHFYYNQKINCLSAEGFFSVGGERREHAGLGVLDWGRGVWTYRNTWYWASLSCMADGVPFGFNLGYGFGDTSAATENMVFYGHKAHKLGEVGFEIPRSGRRYEYLTPWRIADTEGRLELTFTPILDRASDTNALVIRSDQHQVFGRFSGRAVLDDGKEILIKDKTGFAERVYNKW